MTPVFEALRGALRRSVGASIIVLAAIGSLPSVRALAAEQKTTEAPKPAPPPPVAIPLADIAARGTEVSNLLVILTTSAAASAAAINVRRVTIQTSLLLVGQRPLI